MKKRILLVSHYSGDPGGPVDKFYEFLKENYDVERILYPLWPDKHLPVIIQTGRKKFEFTISYKFQFLLEGIITPFMIRNNVKERKPIDLTICFDSLSFINIYLFNKFYKAKKVVFYNIDYSKERFPNTIVNFIYQLCNKYAYKKCDYFFSLYSSLIEDIDPQKKLAGKSFLIKSTVDLRHINRKIKMKQNSLVYAGTLRYSTIDFNPMLKALKKLKRNGSMFTLDLYGKVSIPNKLQNRIKSLKLDDRIFFKGTVENSILINDVLPGYKIGLAPYVTKGTKGAPDHAFLGTDLTAKLVDYLGAGLPVITVELNDGFKVITESKCGFLVAKEKEWHKALSTLLTNDKIYSKYRKNALQVARGYDVEKVFGTVLKKILST